MNLKACQQFTLVTMGKIIEMLPIRSVADSRGLLVDCGDYSSDDYRERATVHNLSVV
ncbi:MAG: hypothetical protein IME94_09945 [Proteobacteria bacterium]|nr:hypothetical protein [Pseudomonadota bacterium]